MENLQKEENTMVIVHFSIVSETANINLIESVITEEDFVNNISNVIWHLDQPLGGPGSFSQYMISGVASDHVKVVLGGQGGDETFGGYARYLVAYLQHCFDVAIGSQGNLNELPISFEDMIPGFGGFK